MASSTPPPPPGAGTGQNGKIKNQAFEDAYRHFFNSLSPKEQLLYSPCASHDDFIDAMRKLEEIANKRRKRGASRLFDRIAKLSYRLQPFFGVVNIMIQSNPEYTALAWGALRFILQLASSFSAFFEKLITTLERFCYEIRQYQTIRLREDQISHRIKEVTEKVYGHMFQFFGEVANVFTSRGMVKRTPVVIAEILWRPFEHRFDDLLKQIQSYRSLIEFDLLLAQAQNMNDMEAIASAQIEIAEREQEENRKAREKADELAKMTNEIARMISQSHRDSERLFERIQNWLSAPQYSDALFHGKSLREPGTNEWIFTNPRFSEWRDSEWAVKPSGQEKRTGPNILWIKGNPGTGKSVLASSIIDEIKETYAHGGQKQEVCYFFFTLDSKGSTSRIQAYRSVLAQILHRNRQDDTVINKFDFIMTDLSSSGTPKAGLDELLGLVSLLFQRLQISLILDGIDECEDNSSLIGEIMELSESSSAKILLCGRNNTASLIRAVPADSQICLDRDVVHADIRLSISTQVDVLLDDELLPLGSNSEDLVNHLCRGADGMFLWAKLMFNYLGLPVHDPYSRLEVIRSVIFPEGLEEMYARIVHTIFQAGKTTCDFASGILAWVSYSVQSLTLEELYDQMTFGTPNTKNADSNQLMAFQEKACIVCGGLVELLTVPGQPIAHGVLRYIHLSVKDHFSQAHLNLGPQGPLMGPEAIENLTCAKRCLGYILHHVPTQQGQYDRLPEFTDPRLGPFSGYAARNWVIHLDRSFSSATFNASDISSALEGLAPSLSDLLRDSTKVKFWIHILYSHSQSYKIDGLSSCLDGLALTLRGLHRVPKSIRDLSQAMQLFCRDVSEALKAWDKHLHNSTDVLWDEMTIFSASPFMAGPRKAQVVSMAPAPPPGGKDPQFSLICKVSHTSVDGETTAVVSVWQNLSSMTKSVVKYELWKHNTVPTRLFEVIDHMYRRQIYPISISDDLGSFAVMDRLFVLLPNGNEPTTFTRSTKIPVLYKTFPADPYTTFLKVSPQGRFLLSSDSSIQIKRSGGERIMCARITMFEIENDGPLKVESILHINLKDWNRSEVLEALFHPSHSVVIIRGEIWIAAWNFAKQVGDTPDTSFHMLYTGRHVKSMAVSSCGKFVVVEEKSEKADGKPPIPISKPLTILPIPDEILAPGGSNFTELATSPQTGWQRDQSATGSLLSLRQGDSALHLTPGRPLQQSQIITLSDGTPAQLILAQGGEEVSITRTDLQSKRTDEVINIIRLPQGQRGEEVAATILAPAPGDESIRMILNEKSRQGQQQPNELPIFISRDVNAIRHTFYDGSGQHVDGRNAAVPQQIRNREESESE